MPVHYRTKKFKNTSKCLNFIVAEDYILNLTVVRLLIWPLNIQQKSLASRKPNKMI